jgi:hypothetical protein
MGDEVTLITEEAKSKFRRLLEARDKHAAADAAAKAAKAELDDIELEVFDMCEEQGIHGTLPVPLGPPYGTVKFKTRATHFAKIINPDDLLEYFENRGMVEEVSAPNFVKKRLHEIVREAADNPAMTLPPGLTYYTNRGMTITRPK